METKFLSFFFILITKKVRPETDQELQKKIVLDETLQRRCGEPSTLVLWLPLRTLFLGGHWCRPPTDDRGNRVMGSLKELVTWLPSSACHGYMVAFLGAMAADYREELHRDKTLSAPDLILKFTTQTIYL